MSANQIPGTGVPVPGVHSFHVVHRSEHVTSLTCYDPLGIYHGTITYSPSASFFPSTTCLLFFPQIENDPRFIYATPDTIVAQLQLFGFEVIT